MIATAALLTASVACGGIAVIDGSGGAAAGGGGTAGSGGETNGGGGTLPCVGDLKANPDHCGYCEHSCLGGACVGGVCQPVLVADAPDASALAVDGSHVYFASPISRVAKGGGAPQELANTVDNVWGVAVDDTNVYWADIAVGLYQLPKGGGEPLWLAPSSYSVAVDATDVYAVWDGVRKVPIGGGEITSLASAGGPGIALDDDWVYFSIWSPGALWKVPKAGGPAIELAKADYSNYVAAFGGVVYWTSGEGRLNAISTSGGQPWVVHQGVHPYGVWADADGVYWTDLNSGEVRMLPAGEESPLILASDQHSPRDITTDASAVYWTNDPIYGAVMKVAKP